MPCKRSVSNKTDVVHHVGKCVNVNTDVLGAMPSGVWKQKVNFRIANR